MIRRNDGIWELNDNEMNAFSFFAKVTSLMYKDLGSELIINKAKEINLNIYKILDTVGFYNKFKRNILN